MNQENITNASNKLESVDDKLECIISAFAFINIDSCAFNDKDVSVFNLILKDLQKELKEVKKLLD